MNRFCYSLFLLVFCLFCSSCQLIDNRVKGSVNPPSVEPTEPPVDLPPSSAVAVAFEFSIQPLDGQTDIAIPSIITVRALDKNNIFTSGYSGSISIGIENDPTGNSGISGILSMAAVNGAAQFSNVVIHQKGLGFRLNATSSEPNVAKAVSESFDLIQPIYRSVGYNSTTARQFGAGNPMTISGFTASFDLAINDDIGIGDAIQYDSDGNASIESIVFVHLRLDNKTYLVKTALGGTPTPVQGDENWSIFRAYDSWLAATSGSGNENPGIDPSVKGFETWSNTRDIVTANEEWNSVFYADAIFNSNPTLDNGGQWTTNERHWRNFIVPASINHVGVSQRHKGVWSPTSTTIDKTANTSRAIVVCSPFIKIEGFQIYAQNNAIDFSGTGQCLAGDGRSIIANNIIRGEVNASFGRAGIYLNAPAVAVTNYEVSIYNNIIYDWKIAGTGLTVSNSKFKVFAYNNIAFGNNRGFDAFGGFILGKNNIAVNNLDVDYRGPISNWTGSTHNLSSDSTAFGTLVYPNKTVQFVNASAGDFRLQTADVEAQGKGINLANDPDLPLTTDINGQVRNGWDLGPFAAQNFGLLTTWNALGSGTSLDPYQLFTKAQLQDFSANGCGISATAGCTADFIVNDNIDLNNEPFTPIGTGQYYQGVFDGNNKTISNLYINLPSTDRVGLIATLCNGSLINIVLEGVDINGQDTVGALVGLAGTPCGGSTPQITGCAVINGFVRGRSFVGGLGGDFPSAITSNSNSNVTVIAGLNGNLVGGLIGRDVAGSISNSFALGSVISSSFEGPTGGLVGGKREGSITGSYAAGRVTSTGKETGGLVGSLGNADPATISNSYAVGDVTGLDSVGGLVGLIAGASSVTNSFALGDVRGLGNKLGGGIGEGLLGTVIYTFSHGNVSGSGNDVGGFIGVLTAGSVDNSYSTGDVSNLSGLKRTGGFVGRNQASMSFNYATGSVYSNGDAVGGFVGENFTAGVIDSSHASGSVFGINDVGGFVGEGLSNSSVTTSLSYGDVLGTLRVGGFLGSSLGTTAESANFGNVIGSNSVGGFAGALNGGTIFDSYTRASVTSGFAFVGAFGGGALITNYWDSSYETSNGSNLAASTPSQYEPLTTTELFATANLVGFDPATWTQLDTTSLPTLKISSLGQCYDNATALTYNAIGLGTQVSPYVLCHTQQWEDLIANACSASVSTDCDQYFELGRDLNFQAKNIGQVAGPGNFCFSGEMDGKGFTIYNFKMDQGGGSPALFNCVSGRIKNLNLGNVASGGLTNVAGLVSELSGQIINSTISGRVEEQGINESTGGLVGLMTGGLVSHSQFDGTIIGDRKIGGLVGHVTAQAYSLIHQSTFLGDLTGVSALGGIVGAGRNSITNETGKFKKLKSFGQATITNGSSLGGITGEYGDVAESLSHMTLTGVSSTKVGGLAGQYAGLLNSYNQSPAISGSSEVAGAIGKGGEGINSYSVVNSALTGFGFIANGDLTSSTQSFFDQSTSGNTSGVSGGSVENKTTAELQTLATFVGWDFTNVWQLGVGVRSPRLRWELHPLCLNNMTATAYSDLGSGTVADPYRICFKDQLMDIGQSGCNGVTNTACAAHFLVLNDIDLAEDTSAIPIGSLAFPFAGSFNGNHHNISGLKIIAPGANFQGFFGRSVGLLININLIDVNIEGNSLVGGLTGDQNGTSSNIFVSGQVVGNNTFIGGITGFLGSGGKLLDSGARIAVSGNGSVSYVGGLVGSGDVGGTRCLIMNSYSTGSVTNNSGLTNRTGGLIGSSPCDISNSWTSAAVSGQNLSGGFAGTIRSGGSITNSYSTGPTDAEAGFVASVDNGSKISNCFRSGSLTYSFGAGEASGFVRGTDTSGVTIEYSYALGAITGAGPLSGFIQTIGAGTFLTNNYWDEESTGVNSADSVGEYEGLLNSSDLYLQGNFSGWDFTNTWIIRGNNSPEHRP